MSTASANRTRFAGVLAATLVLTTGIAGAGTDAAAPGSRPAPSAAPAPAPARVTSAWLPHWGGEAAYQDALAHAAQLHTVSPFWYQATSETTIAPHPGAGDQRIVEGFHSRGIKVVPTVTETLDARAMADLLNDPTRRTAHVDTLVRLAESPGYDGVDLDYERMAETDDEDLRGQVRLGYNTLASELCRRLHTIGKQCVVTVLPYTRDSGHAYDYAHLGGVVDRLRIMGYNLHHAEGAPGPLSSLAWYDEFLRHATNAVPVDRIEVALPAYGWDWTVGSTDRAKHLTTLEAEALRLDKKATYRLDPESGTPHFTYVDQGHTHEVWYQDAKGVAAHLAIMRTHGVRGSGLWALGFEDPALWGVLAEGWER
ncbi:glycosyl hydrolase family 18 protein [Embleya sp. NPDC127516]|uniref:glycosyl hydrolase family 18 protein n=1 Tax=Embleya sp. NPDC127516 TaxID=3363990 RepID=UPI0037F2A3B1